MKGGLADGLAVVVRPGPVFSGGQHVPVPVQHRPGGELALGVVKVAVKSGGGPVPSLGEIAEEKHDHSRRQNQGQQKADHRPVFNFLHTKTSFPVPRFPSFVPPQGVGDAQGGARYPLKEGNGAERMPGFQPGGVERSF